jgi:hypothetical protein
MKYTIEYVPGAGTYTAHRDGVRMENHEIVDLLNQHEKILNQVGIKYKVQTKNSGGVWDATISYGREQVARFAYKRHLDEGTAVRLIQVIETVIADSERL